MTEFVVDFESCGEPIASALSFAMTSDLSAAKTLSTNLNDAQSDDSFIISSESVLEQLEQSVTVYSWQLKATQEFSKSQGLVQFNNGYQLLDSADDRYRILSLAYKPKNFESLGKYPVIHVQVYFTTPSHFEQTTGKKSVNFYKFESTVDVVNTGGPKN